MVLTQQQLKARKNFIGSSEANIIANGSYSKWFDLIQEKKHGVEKLFDKQTKFLLDAGSHMEEFVLNKGAEMMKMKFDNRQSGKTVDHGIAPIHSTYDAIASDGKPVEAKTHWQFRNMDELCDLYAPQCQHHIHTSAKDGCYLVVFFGVRCHMEYRLIKRDQAWIDNYLEQCVKFWSWYRDGVEPEGFELLPPVDWSDMVTMNMEDLPIWSDQMASEMRVCASDIIESKQAIDIADTAKSMFKHHMPDNCRKMTFDIGGNHKGHKIVMTRSKTTKSITLKHTPPKGDDNG
jgi:hypothetical protein